MLMFTATARRSHPELFICCFHHSVFSCFCLLLFFAGILLSSATSAASSLSCEPNIDSCQVNEAPTPSGSKIPTHIKAWSWPKVERCARASADVRACGRRHRESTAIFIVTASHSGPVFNCTMPILLLYYFWFYYPFFCLASCCPVAWRLASDIILLTSTKPSRHCGA